MVRSPVRGASLLPLLLLTSSVVVACGKKGPPLPPLRVAPVRIQDLSVARTGDEVRAMFTIPAANDDKTQPADIVAVELYAITGKAEDPFGQPLSGADFVRLADEAGRLEIAPPPDPDAPPPPPNAPPPPPDPRPAQGTAGLITETLTAEDREVWVHPRKKTGSPPEAPAPRTETIAVPLWAAPAEDPLARTYIALGVSRRGHRAAVSNRVAVPLVGAPGVPEITSITHDATSATITWEAPAGTPLAIQRAANPGELEARSLAPSRTPTMYNVYRMRMAGATPTVDPVPVNPAPTASTAVLDPAIALGEERCYVVRAMLVYGNARVEGEPSEPVCQRFADTFAPAAPANLSAVGSEGGVSLIWDPGNEADLAGYLVLRGPIGPDGTAGALEPLMAEPIRETTYRDTTARPGVRYVYAVVAVDSATPRNQSPESNRVEEGVR